LEKLLLPFLSFTQKSQWQSIISTMIRMRGEVYFPFISHLCEAECPSSPLPTFEPCPSSQHDITFEKENFWAMDKLKAPTLGLEMNDSTNKHESFSFEFPRVSCTLLESLELIALSTTSTRKTTTHHSSFPNNDCRCLRLSQILQIS
jgi:hypothetical protein